MADLGVTAALSPAAFLDATAGHKQTDPGHGGGAVRRQGRHRQACESPQGSKYRPGERWPALEQPTWRPDIRAAVV
ncbi:hypothetical protein [Streptomyces sp. NPDC020983]|uniref:hypothetical protein n=1 Tax=Streptomyces sp. NPDC020983 TaxID=3365106 RepID=UPI0037A1F28C